MIVQQLVEIAEVVKKMTVFVTADRNAIPWRRCASATTSWPGQPNATNVTRSSSSNTARRRSTSRRNRRTTWIGEDLIDITRPTETFSFEIETVLGLCEMLLVRSCIFWRFCGNHKNIFSLPSIYTGGRERSTWRRQKKLRYLWFFWVYLMSVDRKALLIQAFGVKF